MRLILILAIIMASFQMKGDELIFLLDKENMDKVDGVAIDFEIIKNIDTVCDGERCLLEIMFTKDTDEKDI